MKKRGTLPSNELSDQDKYRRLSAAERAEVYAGQRTLDEVFEATANQKIPADALLNDASLDEDYDMIDVQSDVIEPPAFMTREDDMLYLLTPDEQMLVHEAGLSVVEAFTYAMEARRENKQPLFDPDLLDNLPEISRLKRLAPLIKKEQLSLESALSFEDPMIEEIGHLLPLLQHLQLTVDEGIVFKATFEEWKDVDLDVMNCAFLLMLKKISFDDTKKLLREDSRLVSRLTLLIYHDRMTPQQAATQVFDRKLQRAFNSITAEDVKFLKDNARNMPQMGFSAHFLTTNYAAHMSISDVLYPLQNQQSSSHHSSSSAFGGYSQDHRAREREAAARFATKLAPLVAAGLLTSTELEAMKDHEKDLVVALMPILLYLNTSYFDWKKLEEQISLEQLMGPVALLILSKKLTVQQAKAFTPTVFKELTKLFGLRLMGLLSNDEAIAAANFGESRALLAAFSDEDVNVFSPPRGRGTLLVAMQRPLDLSIKELLKIKAEQISSPSFRFVSTTELLDLIEKNDRLLQQRMRALSALVNADKIVEAEVNDLTESEFNHLLKDIPRMSVYGVSVDESLAMMSAFEPLVERKIMLCLPLLYINQMTLENIKDLTADQLEKTGLLLALLWTQRLSLAKAVDLAKNLPPSVEKAVAAITVADFQYTWLQSYNGPDLGEAMSLSDAEIDTIFNASLPIRDAVRQHHLAVASLQSSPALNRGAGSPLMFTTGVNANNPSLTIAEEMDDEDEYGLTALFKSNA